MVWVCSGHNQIIAGHNQKVKRNLLAKTSFVEVYKKSGVIFVFYDRFMALCKDRGKSAAAVVRDMGLNNSAPTTWKRGAIPKGDTLQKLANYFEVSIDYLLDLTPEDRAELQYVEDYVVKQTGRNREDVRISLINEKILDIPHDIYTSAVEAADAAVVNAFKAVPDRQLKEYILEDFRFLNRRGRIEAAMRITELTENYRFKAQKQSEPTPQSPPAPQEGKDTTPPPDAPETAPEGE